MMSLSYSQKSSERARCFLNKGRGVSSVQRRHVSVFYYFEVAKLKKKICFHQSKNSAESSFLLCIETERPAGRRCVSMPVHELGVPARGRQTDTLRIKRYNTNKTKKDQLHNWAIQLQILGKKCKRRYILKYCADYSKNIQLFYFCHRNVLNQVSRREERLVCCLNFADRRCGKQRLLGRSKKKML